MKIVNATWMAARPHWCFWSMGLMNSVQPYCRLAIITVQMMPSESWPHRVHGDGAGCASDFSSVAVMFALLRMCGPHEAKAECGVNAATYAIDPALRRAPCGLQGARPA